jgi:predicted transcriptional regulator
MRHRPIGEQLRAWRAARGLSQVAVAERAGVGFVLIARLEVGATDPRLSSIRKLAEALKLTVGELVDGDPTKAKRPARKRARGKR